jgi:peptide chain release factor 2
VETLPNLEQEYEDIQVMIEMGYEENDPLGDSGN